MTRWKLGFSYELNEWLEGSTELSQGAIEEDTTLHQGLNSTWKMNELTTFTLGIEHSREMETSDTALTSVALGAKWESYDKSWVGDADLETTFEKSGRTHYASLGLAGEVSPDLTALGRMRVALDERNDRDSLRLRSRAGLAYRPVADPRLEMLAWYEHRLEEENSRTETHLWSVDAAYEVDQDLRMNGKYAGQHQKITTESGVSAAALTQLVQAGVYYEFSDDRFQIGLNASHMWDDSGTSANGIGAEVGISPAEGTLLAVGYNKSTRDMPGLENLYQEGFYFRFNLLLDNSLWGQLDGFLGN